MWPDSTTKPELQWLFNCQQFAASEALRITIMSHAVRHDGFRRRLTGQVVRHAGVDVPWRQIVHRVVRFTRDLAIYFEKTWQLKLISRQRRERLQYHQSFTPAENTRPSLQQRQRQWQLLVFNVTVNRVIWQWIKWVSKLTRVTSHRSRLATNWPANQKCQIKCQMSAGVTAPLSSFYQFLFSMFFVIACNVLVTLLAVRVISYEPMIIN